MSFSCENISFPIVLKGSGLSYHIPSRQKSGWIVACYCRGGIPLFSPYLKAGNPDWMEKMIALYILAFCRIVTGLVFAFSSISKARHPAQFREAILGFELLPPRFSGLAALLFLCGEFAVVLLVAIGGPLLSSGFVMATLLLCIFCVA